MVSRKLAERKKKRNKEKEKNKEERKQQIQYLSLVEKISEYPNEYQITHKNIKRPFQHRLISFLTHQTQKKDPQ